MLEIVRNDITLMQVDAIVNAANETLLGGGGVDGAIHKAAGEGLLQECRALGGCKTGEAKITGAYNLPAKYVIHTVGPIWQGGDNDEENKLINCYRNSLKLAVENNCSSIAFPLISADVYGYPKAEALRIAIETINSYISSIDICAYLVIFDKEVTEISRSMFEDIEEYIDNVYVDKHSDNSRSRRLRQNSIPIDYAEVPISYKYAEPVMMPMAPAATINLDDIDDIIDERFAEMLLRKIDELGIKDSDCYKKAGVDRKLFSKIRTNPDYKPKKKTAIAFAIALELNLEETKELLLKAGYALSHCSKFDIIIEYFIMNGNYDLFAINEALYKFDQELI